MSDPGDPTVTSTHRVQAFKTTGEFLRSSPTAGAGYFWVHDLEYSSYVERVMAFGRLADKYRAFGELFIIELSIGLSWYQHLLTSA